MEGSIFKQELSIIILEQKNSEKGVFTMMSDSRIFIGVCGVNTGLKIAD